MASAAAELGLSTGLKNAQEILTSVIDVIQFAVNEECVTAEDTSCSEYESLLSAGKPVLHIEYVDGGNSGNSGDNDGNSGDNNDGNSGDDNNDGDNDGKKKKTPKKAKKPAPAANLDQLCVKNGLGDQLSTVVKYLALDGWVEYCDGSEETTAINGNYETGDPKQGGKRTTS
jgi:hypothetical protein